MTGVGVPDEDRGEGSAEGGDGWEEDGDDEGDGDEDGEGTGGVGMCGLRYGRTDTGDGVRRYGFGFVRCGPVVR